METLIEKGLNTKRSIIEKSAVLFNTKGYEGCSLSDIMEATGLKKGGIYNHFINKDEIALAAFDYASTKVKRRYKARLTKDKSPLESMITIIELFKESYENPVIEGGCPIINTAIDAENMHPLLQEKALEVLDELTRLISHKVREGIEKGVFMQSANENEVADVFLSSLYGAVLISRVKNDYKYVSATSKYLMRYITENIVR